MSKAFFEQVRAALRPEGIIIANTLAFSEEHREGSQRIFDDVFSKVFPKGQIIKTHLNYMLINDPEYFTSSPNK